MKLHQIKFPVAMWEVADQFRQKNGYIRKFRKLAQTLREKGFENEQISLFITVLDCYG